MNPNRWYKVFDITDNKGVCHTLSTYMYKVWFQLEEDIGMEPNKCPLRKVCFMENSSLLVKDPDWKPSIFS